jgi:hypothetical protein
VGGVASTPPRVVHASRPSVPVSAGGSLSSRFPLFKVEDPNCYCLGVIGSELKNDRFPWFCLEARGECTFSTHQSRHFRGEIQPGFYPKGTTRGRAFCYKTPFLSLEEGIPEARTRVLVGERSLVDWIKICEALPGTEEDALDDLLHVTTVSPMICPSLALLPRSESRVFRQSRMMTIPQSWAANPILGVSLSRHRTSSRSWICRSLGIERRQLVLCWKVMTNWSQLCR